MKCRHTTSIAAHLLGALEPAEALELEQHYRNCPDCCDELILLAPLPGLLHRASPAAENAPLPARRPARRPRRLRLGAASVVLVLLGISGAVGYVTGQSKSVPPVVAVTANWSHTFGTMPGLHVTADLTTQPWGTEVRLHLDNPPSTRQCRLVVFTSDGSQQTIGWWTTGYYTDADITTSTSVPIADMTRLEILDTTDNLLAGITK